MNGHVLYEFEEYRVDPARRELWRGADQVSVQPKAFDCLAYLIQHRDRVVGNDELIAAVWGRTDLSDNVVMHSIARARHAVGDSGELQRAIRTVTRVGYAWNLPVALVDTQPVNGGGRSKVPVHVHAAATGHDDGGVGPPSAAHSATDGVNAESDLQANGHSGSLSTLDRETVSSAGGSKRGHVRLWWVAVAATVLVTVLLAVGLFSPRRSNPDPIIGEAAVVLPVTVAGGVSSQTAWIRLGVMDLIAERLREFGQIVIPSDNTIALARTYLGSGDDGAYAPEDVETLAHTASVGLVLGAEAEPLGAGRWRVSLRTIHGRDPSVVAQGEAVDLLAASRAAADRMAIMLGFGLTSAATAAPAAGTEVEYALRQVRAALLSDRFDQARQVLEGLNEAQRRDPDVRSEIAALDARKGLDDEAATELQSLLSELSGSSKSLLKAKSMRELGSIYARQNDYARAASMYEGALDALHGKEGYEHRLLAGKILMSTASLLGLQGRLDEAEADYAKARIAFEISGDQFALAKLDANLSSLYTRMGRSEAVAYAKRSAERLGQFGDVQNELRARVHLVIAYCNEQDIAAAAEEVRRFDALLTKVDNPTFSAQVRIYELAVFIESGQLTAAEHLLKRLRQEPFDDSSKARMNYLAAGYAFASRDFESVAALAELATRATWEPGVYGEQAEAWLLLHRAQVELGRYDLASKTLQRAMDWGAVAADRRDVELPLVLMKAEHAAAAGDTATTASNFEQALSLANRWGQPYALVRVVKPYAKWLIANGALDQAATLAGRVSNWADRSYDAAWVQLDLYHALGEPGGWRLALKRVRALAGERAIEPELLVPPQASIATSL